uniref:Uncharacterized protein n=1 Tax=Anguilla anguilla TaxID=7936 RepID=A0A0E9SBN0_ANGAN
MFHILRMFYMQMVSIVLKLPQYYKAIAIIYFYFILNLQ